MTTLSFTTTLTTCLIILNCQKVVCSKATMNQTKDKSMTVLLVLHKKTSLCFKTITILFRTWMN